MVALGLPDFAPVQHNVAFNTAAGTTRSIHAEPWDKLVSVATGHFFGAWVDLREGPTFGAVFTAEIGETRAVSHAELDITDSEALAGYPWRDYDTIINAAAYTQVDEAETPQGRRDAWAINVSAVSELARIANRFNLTLVTVSSDYVFDGQAKEHTEDEPLSPLGVYGQTKAAGEAVTATVDRHYVVRTSWLVGDGHNFVATMDRLAANGISPEAVDDQFGILTPATELAAGIKRLLDEQAPYGIHHITGSGPVQSWADIAREVFARNGRDAQDVTGVSTADYSAGKSMAPRPAHSTLRSTKTEKRD